MTQVLPTEVASHDVKSWHEVLSKRFSPIEFTTRSTADFNGAVAQLDLEDARMSRVRSPAGQFLRSAQAVRRDSFDGFLILLCFSGELRLAQKDRHLVAKAGEALIYRQGVPFTLEAPAAYQAYSLWVTPDMMMRHCPQLADSAPIVLSQESANGPFALSMVQQLCQASVSAGVVKPMCLVGAALDVVSTSIAAPDGREHLERNNQVILHLADHLRRNPDCGDLDLDHLVNLSGVSARTLNRIFVEIGTTPMRWVRDQRLGHAYQALKEARVRNVTEAAFSFGFKDTAHFSRAFSGKYGVPPGRILRRDG